MLAAQQTVGNAVQLKYADSEARLSPFRLRPWRFYGFMGEAVVTGAVDGAVQADPNTERIRWGGGIITPATQRRQILYINRYNID